MPAPHPDGHQSPSGSAIFHRDHMKCQAYMASFDVPLVLWLGSLGGLGSLFGSRWFDVFFGAAPQKNDFLNWQGLKQTPQTPKLPKPSSGRPRALGLGRCGFCFRLWIRVNVDAIFQSSLRFPIGCFFHLAQDEGAFAALDWLIDMSRQAFADRPGRDVQACRLSRVQKFAQSKSILMN